MQPWLIVVLIQVVTIVGITIVGLLLKNYLPNYLGEKAKHLAQKEDIAEITSKVEEVKNIYASDLQRIKAALDTQNQKYLHLYEKRSDALAHFFDDCWLLASRLRVPVVFRPDDFAGLDAYIKETVDLISHAISSEHRLKIYLPPGNIIDSADKVMAILCDLHDQWQEQAISYRRSFLHAAEEIARRRFKFPQDSSPSLQSLRQFNTEHAGRIDLALRDYAAVLNGNLNSANAEEFLLKAAAVRFGNVPVPEVAANG